MTAPAGPANPNIVSPWATTADVQNLRDEMKEMRREQREEFAKVNDHLARQNGRVAKNESKIELLFHEASQAEKEAAEARADARSDRQMKEWRKMFEEYVKPLLQVGTFAGVLYSVLKAAGWLP